MSFPKSLCKSAGKWMDSDAFLADPKTVPAELQEHIKTCPVCSARYRDETALLAWAEADERDVPDGLHESIMQKVRESEQVRQPKRSNVFPRIGGIAAAFAGVFLLVMLIAGPGRVLFMRSQAPDEFGSDIENAASASKSDSFPNESTARNDSLPEAAEAAYGGDAILYKIEGDYLQDSIEGGMTPESFSSAEEQLDALVSISDVYRMIAKASSVRYDKETGVMHLDLDGNGEWDISFTFPKDSPIAVFLPYLKGN